MEVGSNPARSPYNASFDGAGIPRIRSQSIPGADAAFESKHWLTWLRDRPELLFTSDGNPATVSYPRATTQQVAARFRARGRPY